jgi:hypothetical protein
VLVKLDGDIGALGWSLSRGICYRRHATTAANLNSLQESLLLFFAAPIHFKHHLVACEGDVRDLNGDAWRDELAGGNGGFLVLLPVELTFGVDVSPLLLMGKGTFSATYCCLRCG